MTNQGKLKAPHLQEVPRMAPDRFSSPKGHVWRGVRVRLQHVEAFQTMPRRPERAPAGLR